ncbi:MAG: hypothetical protein ACYC3X_03575 [Pirellulaceae bacterium]
MSITGRLLGWVLPGVLCCGGCATHSLVEPPAAVPPPVASEEAVPGRPVASPPTVETREEADRDAREAAAIRGAVQKQGYSEESASRFAEAVLGAYAELSREAAANPASIAPRSTTDEGVPLAPVDTASTPSPAATETPGVSPPLLPSNVADIRAARPASSVFSPATSPNDTQKSPPAVPTVSVAVGAHRPGPIADVARPSPVAHRPDETKSLDAPAAPADARLTTPPTARTADSPDGSAVKSSDADQPPNSWRQQIKLAAEQLRAEMENGTMDDEQRARCQVYLSLLLLAEEDPEKAVAALEDFDDQQLEFWRQTVLGMGILLDSDELPKFRHRIDSASEHFSRAVSSLSTLGPLCLSNLAFCTKVNGFGDFVDCSAYGLEAGKPVLLYVEVENYTVEPIETEASQNGRAPDPRRSPTRANGTPKYVTELHGRYEILDANQQTIASRILPVGRDECRNRRRDYYISYVVYLPEHIQPGPYTLELTIEDKKGAKFGNAVIDFRVK